MAFLPDTRRYIEISRFEYDAFAEKKGTIDGLIKHRKDKNHGELEPQLQELAEGNPRVNLQNYVGPQSKLE